MTRSHEPEPPGGSPSIRPAPTALAASRGPPGRGPDGRRSLAARRASGRHRPSGVTDLLRREARLPDRAPSRRGRRRAVRRGADDRVRVARGRRGGDRRAGLAVSPRLRRAADRLRRGLRVRVGPGRRGSRCGGVGDPALRRPLARAARRDGRGSRARRPTHAHRLHAGRGRVRSRGEGGHERRPREGRGALARLPGLRRDDRPLRSRLHAGRARPATRGVRASRDVHRDLPPQHVGVGVARPRRP